MSQDTIQPRSGVTYVFNGKKYYLCCAGCLEAFRQAPQAHSHAVDPVPGSIAPASAAHAPISVHSSVLPNLSK
jgi:YHS domain-containing protein